MATSSAAVPMVSEASPLQEADQKRSSWSFFGPGMLACLADTDAGCLIVAAQSGYRWGYSLLPLQVVLIPVLYFAQELTIRLGVHTQQGLTALIRKNYGTNWAWFTCFLLLLECVGAIVSEMSGIAAVAGLWGMNRVVATFMAGAVVIGVVVCCSYRQIEKVGVLFGLFELAFVGTMFAARPDWLEVLRESRTFHPDPAYTRLIAANIGAVIMPWMIYFQQSAIVARRITAKGEADQERTQTLIGSMLTQLVMIGALVTMAALRTAGNLDTVHEIVTALEPVFGYQMSRMVITLAFTGGAMCASFVVSLAATWAVNEALDLDDTTSSLDRSPTEAPYFYGAFISVIALGAAILLSGVNIVRLNILVELMDGLLLPFAIGFLFLLASSDVLPAETRLAGAEKWMLGSMFTIVTTVSVGMGVHSVWEGGI